MEKRMKQTLSVDLIIEIISRLPVEDLMRFKCVSKSWLSLISSDSHLSRLQLERVASSDLPFVVLGRQHSRVDHGVVVNPKELLHYNYWFDLDSFGDDESIDLKDIQNPFDLFDPGNAPRRDGDIVASCDGLLVFCQSKTLSMALLNPSTGKYLMVPPNPAGNQNVRFLCFGYDRGQECYKLVTLVCSPKPNNSFDLMIYYVNSTWRRVETRYDENDDPDPTYEPVFVDNVLYWFFNCQEYPRGFIYYFDLEKEQFGKLENPDFSYDMCTWAEIVAFEEKLCLVCKWTDREGGWTSVGDETERTDIWVLSKAELCWTKLFSISDPKARLNFDIADDWNLLNLTPHFYSRRRNKVLFYISCEAAYSFGDYFQRFVWYNLETKEFEKWDETHSSYVTTCKRSLVGNGMF